MEARLPPIAQGFRYSHEAFTQKDSTTALFARKLVVQLAGTEHAGECLGLWNMIGGAASLPGTCGREGWD